MKKVLLVVALIMLTAFALTSCDDEVNSGPCTVRWAGIRISTYGMRSSFGKGNFPTETEMAGYATNMASCYEGSTGAYILIVGEIHDDGCHLYFPVTGNYSSIEGSESDRYESYLDECDEKGIDVWLQVEPGYGNLVTLADLVMKQYSHHTCVKGFGIDVEWNKPIDGVEEGTKLSDSEAKKVLEKVRSYNQDYTVFVKHWDLRWLPSKIDGLIYVNDSQGFKNMAQVEREFSEWAAYYAPQPVMFQIGYDADNWIWNGTDYSKNPAKLYGQAIVDACNSGNDVGIIWVDMTLSQVINKTDN